MRTARRIAGLAWAGLRLELSLYRALGRWVIRRPDVPPGVTPIAYSRLVAPIMCLWIFASGTEVVVLDVVLRRWVPSLQLPLLVLGVWGLLWMLGLLAAYRVRPHLVDDRVLTLRDGVHARIDVPLAAIAGTRLVGHELPGLLRSVHVEPAEDDGRRLLVGLSGRTNLELVLTSPTILQTPKGPETVTRVGMWVDEPREVAELIRRISSRVPGRLPPPRATRRP